MPGSEASGTCTCLSKRYQTQAEYALHKQQELAANLHRGERFGRYTNHIKEKAERSRTVREWEQGSDTQKYNQDVLNKLMRIPTDSISAEICDREIDLHPKHMKSRS